MIFLFDQCSDFCLFHGFNERLDHEVISLLEAGNRTRVAFVAGEQRAIRTAYTIAIRNLYMTDKSTGPGRESNPGVL